MTTFPLPLPTHGAEPQPAVDLGSVVLTYRCATELAPFAKPVIARFGTYHEAGQLEDGLRTIVGFSQWQLRQDREAQFAITTSDYASGDLVDGVTDDLTFALWIEASQVDATSRAGIDGEDIDMAAGVRFTKAALTVVEKGRPDELVLVRRTPAGRDDSGWLVRTAEKSFLRNKEVDILAGLLVQTAPHLVPLLALPTGTVARVAGGHFLGAWLTQAADGTVSDTDRQLLDAEGTGQGTPLGQRRSAPERETVEEDVDGITLRLRVSPQLAPLAQSTLAGFAAGAAGPLVPGARLDLAYSPFVLEEGEESVLLITAPDFSSPEAYRGDFTDDVTGALWGAATQAHMVNTSGLQAKSTAAGDTVAIQQAALDALVLGTPTPFVMERIGHEPGAEQLADGTLRSGWMITTPSAQTDDERHLLNIDAGELQACDTLFTPYLALPDDVLLQFAGGRLHSAHLIDQAAMEEIADRDPRRGLGDILASGEASRALFTD